MVFQKKSLLLLVTITLFPIATLAQPSVDPFEEKPRIKSRHLQHFYGVKRKVHKKHVRRGLTKRDDLRSLKALQRKNGRKAKHSGVSRNVHAGIERNVHVKTSRNVHAAMGRNVHARTSRNVHAGIERDVHARTSRNVHTGTGTIKNMNADLEKRKRAGIANMKAIPGIANMKAIPGIANMKAIPGIAQNLYKTRKIWPIYSPPSYTVPRYPWDSSLSATYLWHRHTPYSYFVPKYHDISRTKQRYRRF